jgi:hypothetical protein
LGGKALLRHSVRMSGVARDNGRAEFDVLSFSADDRLGHDGVVSEDVRHPERVKAAGIEVLGSGDEPIDAAIETGGCTGHNANTHN